MICIFFITFIIDQSISIYKQMQGSATETQDTKNKDGGYLKYLPKNSEERQQLKQAIDNSVNRLKRSLEKKPNQQVQQKIKILQLRLLLIDSCSEMSLLRLDHLQWVFKHYCTHIFKTGKHMTFERLQYEKVHLTMERFFLFLKDFELTLMFNGDKKEQVVEKNTVILFFKKISTNCRDLSFQQFIRCLEKLAIVYYDEKQIFYKKKQRLRQQKDKRKQDYEKRKMQRLKKKEGKEEVSQPKNDQQNQQKQNIYDKQQENEQQKGEQNVGEQNDELVKDLMNDKELENPTEEINKITNRYALEEEAEQTPEGQNIKTNYSEISDDMLLLLTNQEKIEYYYKFIVKVDSVKEYRDKLTELNLPIFNKGKSKARTSTNSQSKIDKGSEDEQMRIQQLKKKMQEKKLKQKASPIPKPKDDGAWVKAEQDRKRKRQVKKQRQQKAKQKNKVQSDALLQKKLDSQKTAKQKKPEYNQKEIDWNSIGKMSIDQLKMNKFNPNRYFTKDDDDKIFLDQYQNGPRQRIASGMEIRERNSLSIVQDAKKRVGQVEKKQKKQQKQLDNLSKKIGQNIPVKNRF